MLMIVATLQKGGKLCGHCARSLPRSALARGWRSLDRSLMKPLLTNTSPSLQVAL